MTPLMPNFCALLFILLLLLRVLIFSILLLCSSSLAYSQDVFENVPSHNVTVLIKDINFFQLYVMSLLHQLNSLDLSKFL